MNQYIKKYGWPKSYLESHKVSLDCELIIVIPCFNEPNILPTLHSLFDSKFSGFSIEVIIVVNASEVSKQSSILQNKQTILQIECFVKQQQHSQIPVHIIEEMQLPKKHAGVGLARKIGMDEAVRRFYSIAKEGIIVCFDADATCSKNYIQGIYEHFKSNPKTPGCSIHYEHPLEGIEPVIKRGIIDYELHLRYYVNGLRYAGSQVAYHTIGSSMAVRSEVYTKQNGMNKRKAGEDFYFIHKIIPLGNYSNLNTVSVFPSARISDRVPFGTGRAIGEYVERESKETLTYNFDVFEVLKEFLNRFQLLYKEEGKIGDEKIDRMFLTLGWLEQIAKIRTDARDQKHFNERFLLWFNGFRVLKFVHYLKDHYFDQQLLLSQVNKLEVVSGLNESDTQYKALMKWRFIDKNYV